MEQFQVSVCICTRNRPDDLRKALESVSRSVYPVHEIIVSDDSTDELTRELVEFQFPSVRYLSGPRRGLCANRNHALKAVTGTHVLFIDDDVVLDPHFLARIYDCWLANPSPRHKVIITGLELRNGHLIYPHDQDFLGYQVRPYQQREMVKTVVINSTVFPMTLFQEMCFDEQLVYGYDEVDLTTRAVARNYRIILCERAVNCHYPSPVNRDLYRPYIEASRLYVTYKRYVYSEGKRIKGWMFLVIAGLHNLFHSLKRAKWQGWSMAAFTFKTALSYIRHYARVTPAALRPAYRKRCPEAIFDRAEG